MVHVERKHFLQWLLRKHTHTHTRTPCNGSVFFFLPKAELFIYLFTCALSALCKPHSLLSWKKKKKVVPPLFRPRRLSKRRERRLESGVTCGRIREMSRCHNYNVTKSGSLAGVMCEDALIFVPALICNVSQSARQRKHFAWLRLSGNQHERS